jgi:beta-galactosidase/beta-glucuronidase
VTSTPPALHPRPQFAREEWVELDGAWQFAFDDADAGLDDRWWAREDVFDLEIQVPYPPESRRSGLGETGFHPVVWYRRVFECPRPDDDDRVLLTFGAVDYRATVYVNGHRLVDHEGGHSSFTVDVTPALSEASAEQVLVVRAEDWHDDVRQPRGKQDWRADPHVIWYHRTTGIWQPVWWERVARNHLSAIQVSADVVAGRVEVEAEVPRPLATGLALRCRVRFEGEVLADVTVGVGDPVVRASIDLPASRNRQDVARFTWSPEQPHLLDVDLELQHDGEAVDVVRSYTGFRQVGYADGHFLLNSHPYFLRLVLAQGYWPESHLAAPSPDALRREVELIKELGFNGVRVHQKVEDPRFLYWCDRLGLLTWGEMPSAYDYSPATVERLTREWQEVVRRDRSHPSLVTWVPLNESWGFDLLDQDAAQRHFASSLYHLTKALDPTRPAISNDGWEHTESDIWGIHDYGPTGAGLSERYGTPEGVEHHLREGRPGRRRVLLVEGTDRGQPVVITEMGGVSFAPGAGEEWFGYSTVGSPDELVEKFSELVGALMDSPVVAGLCWTQLTDTEQEINGLLTEDREPKAPVERFRAALQRPARSDPASEVDFARAAGQPAVSTAESPGDPSPKD